MPSLPPLFSQTPSQVRILGIIGTWNNSVNARIGDPSSYGHVVRIPRSITHHRVHTQHSSRVTHAKTISRENDMKPFHDFAPSRSCGNQQRGALYRFVFLGVSLEIRGPSLPTQQQETYHSQRDRTRDSRRHAPVADPEPQRSTATVRNEVFRLRAIILASSLRIRLTT